MRPTDKDKFFFVLLTKKKQIADTGTYSVTITRTGLIYLPPSTVRKYFAGSEYMKMYIDSDRRAIAMMPVLIARPGEINIKKLTISDKTHSGVVSIGRSIFSAFNIPEKTYSKLPLREYIDTNGYGKLHYFKVPKRVSSEIQEVRDESSKDENRPTVEESESSSE